MGLEYKCQTCAECPSNTVTTQQEPINCTLKFGNGGTDACYFTDFGDEEVEPRRFLVGDMTACEEYFEEIFNLTP